LAHTENKKRVYGFPHRPKETPSAPTGSTGKIERGVKKSACRERAAFRMDKEESSGGPKRKKQKREAEEFAINIPPQKGRD